MTRTIASLTAVLAALAAAGSSLSLNVNHRPAGERLVLYVAPFVNPASSVALLSVVASSGASPLSVVTWKTNAPDILTLTPIDPRVSNAEPAVPGQIFAGMTRRFGKAMVSASLDAATSLAIEVYTYRSLTLRCQFRYEPAYAFDPGASPSGLTSDLYATESSSPGPLDPCAGTPFGGSAAAVHFPYGGIVVPGGLDAFPLVSANAWRKAATQLPSSAMPHGVLGGILLFKTRAGAIVKVTLPEGPYEVTDASGAFPY